MYVVQRVVIADPNLLQELFVAEREGALEKPDEQPFPIGHVRTRLHHACKVIECIGNPMTSPKSLTFVY